MKRNVLVAMAVALVSASVSTPAFAQVNKTPDLSQAGTWTTDRYDPQVWSAGNVFQGRTNVLDIGVTSAGRLDNRPGPFQNSFYNYQGKTTGVDGIGVIPSGSQYVSLDLWLDQAWGSSSNGLVSTSMWTRVNQVNSDAESGAWYPVLGFTNQGGSGAIRYFDSNLGWQVLGATINYGAWNTFKILYTGNSFEAIVNGQSLYTEGNVDAGTVRLTNVFVEAYNFDNSFGNNANGGAYDARWSNTPTTVPEPSTYVLMASGLLALGLVARRRRNTTTSTIG